MAERTIEDIYVLLIEMSNTMQNNYTRLDAKIDKLDNKIDNVEKRLNEKIDNVEKKLNEKIDKVRKELNEKIDNVKLEFDTKLETTKVELKKEITEELTERFTKELDKRFNQETKKIIDFVNEGFEGIYNLNQKKIESNTKRIIELEKYVFKNKKLKI